jgi:hypothetical protein
MTQTGFQMRLAARGLPVHRNEAFFGSGEGKKVLIFGAALVAVMFAILWGQVTRDRRVRDAVERIAPTVTMVTKPPLAFVPAEVRHRMQSVEDLTEEPHKPGLQALLDHLATPVETPGSTSVDGGVRRRPNAEEITRLEIPEALAAPELFRGGWVSAIGKVSTVWTETISDGSSNAEPRFLYRGVLVYDPQCAGVQFVTLVKPPDFTIVRDELSATGVFLQNIRMKTKDERTPWRSMPLLVLDELKVSSTARGSSAAGSILPIAITVAAAIVVIVFIFVLRHKSRVAALAGVSGRAPRKAP